MELGLSDKRAWVIGGSSGLGRAAAASLAAEGARVAISARGVPDLESAAESLPGVIESVPLDLMDAPSIKQACDEVVDRLGGLDVVLMSSGGPPAGPFAELDEEEFLGAFDLLLRSAFLLAKATLPHLRRSGGALMYVTSSSTKEVIDNLLLSNTMRLGVTGLAKTLAREVAADGVRVLCIAPGRIATDRVASLDAAAADRRGVDVEEVRSDSQGSIPMGRYGDPGEFGDVVAFLASDRASYVTGTTVAVDGAKIRAVAS